MALADLRRTFPAVRGALVATTDGLPISQSFRDGTDADHVAAMAAVALGLGRRMNLTLGTGDLSEMSISGGIGQVYIYATGRRGVLAVVAPGGMNLGILHKAARDTAGRVARIL